MESFPLIAKSNVIPNLDVTPVIREIFQAEFTSQVPSKKLSENLRKSLEYENAKDELEQEKTFRSVDYLEDLQNEKGKLMEYADNVLRAYGRHEKALGKIAKAELNIMEVQAMYLDQEKKLQENAFLSELLRLKRRPLMKPLDPGIVSEFNLLQGETGLPPVHEMKVDFRLKNFKKWRITPLDPESNKLTLMKPDQTCAEKPKAEPKNYKKRSVRPKKAKADEDQRSVNVFKAEPPGVCFTRFTPGEKYECWVKIQNVYSRPIKFLLKSPAPGSPFRVKIHGTDSTRVLPGFTFKLLVIFEPTCLDDELDTLAVSSDNGSTLFIPLISCLEPPLLKTHEDIDELTKSISQRIQSSFIDCGACLAGDSKVTKLRFYSYGGGGEFFIMSLDNWENWHIDSLTTDNFTEIPPFRLYPSYFKLDKGQYVDLFVEFQPLYSGMHADNIIIACNNGEHRNLDILADGISWNRSFIVFQENMEKDFLPYVNDDPQAFYFIDFGCLLTTGKAERSFTVLNESRMPFPFRWELRDAILDFDGQKEPGKISKTEIKIEPSSGVLEPYSENKFTMSLNFKKKEIGDYRAVVSLYITGLPYQCIEQANTIIRPSVARGWYKSGSVFGEDDNLIPSPECSYQGTYESVQGGMKSSSEGKSQFFPMTVCLKHPCICSIPLKKTKTLSDIGENDANTGLSCDDTDFSKIDHFKKLTDLGSDLLWDFVDVLVDEIELWVTVKPMVVFIHPWIINTCDDVKANQPPMKYEFSVANGNSTPIQCRWIIVGKEKYSFDKDEINTIYTIAGSEKHKTSDDDIRSFIRNLSSVDDCLDQNSALFSPKDSSMYYQLMSYLSRGCFGSSDNSLFRQANKIVEIDVEPRGTFTIDAGSKIECSISVTGLEPGVINRVLQLFVENAEEVTPLHVIGYVPDRDFSVFPTILNFGARKRGTRYDKCFKLRNDSDFDIEWKVEQYRYDFAHEALIGPIDEEKQSSLKNYSGTIEGNNCVFERYKLDARKSGLHATILKFEPARLANGKALNKYMTVLGVVQTPRLTIIAPRFNNAILAPSRTMYVGQSFTQTVTLRNMKNVSTTFAWGYPFGCHCRKLRIDMSPKFCYVDGQKKIELKVHITPLEEGIVEHCYVPCFFSRNANPAVLSIVGIIRNLQVVFEIANDKVNVCGEEESQSVIKIPWPIRNFDPTIGLISIHESDILDFKCHCEEVDAHYLTTQNYVEPEDELMEHVMDEEGLYIPGEEPYEEEADVLDSCPRMYYTPSRMDELRKGILKKKGLISEEENEEYRREVFLDYVQEPSDAVPLPTATSDEGNSAVVEYPKKECVNLFYYIASEIRFLNVLHNTVSVRTFSIKNDSPISTSFRVKVKYFSKVNCNAATNRLTQIKNRVFGRGKEEFDDSLMYGQPLVITTSPTEGVLNPWSFATIDVYVYGNTWGEYRDFIICDIDGTPPFIMKVFVQLSGHPVHFPMFGTSVNDIPVLRFNTIACGTGNVERTIKVKNTSAIPITVTWMVFLTSPLNADDKDDPFSICLDLYTEKDSEDQEKTTKSSRNYLSKNTSGSVPRIALMDMDKTPPGFTATDGLSELDSSKKSSPAGFRCSDSSPSPTTDLDATRPEIQILENFGKIDLSVFRFHPRELDLDAYADGKIYITFNPGDLFHDIGLLNFEAVVTGCVRLQQEHAHYPNIYHRLCGQDYVTKLLSISAAVERPVLFFDFCRGDIRFVVNANDVVKSRDKNFIIRRKLPIRNKCQTDFMFYVRLKPGELFSIKNIETAKHIYTNFDYPVSIESGNSLQINLEVVLTFEQVLALHRNLKFVNPKNRTVTASHAQYSNSLLNGLVMSRESELEFDEKKLAIQCSRSVDYSFDSVDKEISSNITKPTDRSKGIKTEVDSVRGNTDSNHNFDYGNPEEYPGESGPAAFQLSYGDVHDTRDSETRREPLYIASEDLCFEHSGICQIIMPELHIFFPCLKIKPEVIDFGNVYLGETSVRYASVVNLTQFPTDMVVDGSDHNQDLVVSPTVARLRATNYKSDLGEELVVKFSPRAPGRYNKVFMIYGNRDMKFDVFTLTVTGVGTWDEKYKYPRHSPNKSRTYDVTAC